MKTALAAFIGFPNEWDPTETATALSQWNSLTTYMGQAPTMMLTYIDFTHPLSGWVTNDTAWEIKSFALGPWGPGKVIPVVGIPMTLQGDDADTDFKAIASGNWDQILNGVFQAWAAAGYTSIDIRPGHEMNGNWYPWSVTQQNVADYVSAFQHIAALAHNFAGLSINVVWSPNAVTFTSLPVSSYYPGNGSVDIIGVDEYGPPLGASDTLPSATSTGPADFTLNTALAMAKANGKQFALAETGAMDTAFPANIASVVAASGASVAYIALWDDNEVAAGGYNWDVTSNPAVAAAWKQAFATIAAAQPTPSANNAVVMASSDTAIVDAVGNKWTITTGNQVAVNGITDTTTGSVKELVYADSLIWEEDASGLWRSKATPSDTWTPSAGTTTSPLPAPAVSTITLNISEDSYGSDAQFVVTVDGVTQGNIMTASALHSSGDANVFTLAGNWSTALHVVGIHFISTTNGSLPTINPHLYVNSIAFNGTTESGTTASLLSRGTNSFTISDTTAATTGPADVLTLNLAEDAWKGNAQFTLSIDGKQITTAQDVDFPHSIGNWEAFTFSGNFGAGSHKIGVAFTNDAYGGSSTTDRNLYINGISLNGQHYGSGVSTLYRNGTATFNVTTLQ